MAQYQTSACPVCADSTAQMMSIPAYALYRVRCPVCGEFLVSTDALMDRLGPDLGNKWLPVKRAALSHALRLRANIPLHDGTGLPWLHNALLKELEDSALDLPTPLQQARNIIRFIGDHERNNGAALERLPYETTAVVGAPNASAVIQLIHDLGDLSKLAFISRKGAEPLADVMHVRLTLAGWSEWEEIHKGRRAATDGFIAMQFGDARLDKFIAEVVQPCVQDALGVKLNRLDSPEVVTAGVIDDIMREAIQNAAFVLVELSHGNRGAYWEGGYAEGLDKPVIYLCDKAVFDDTKKRPHFDVNHCTTVMWEEGKEDEFKRVLAATLRNAMRKAGRDV
jgi:hypothetical protein